MNCHVCPSVLCCSCVAEWDQCQPSSHSSQRRLCVQVWETLHCSHGLWCDRPLRWKPLHGHQSDQRVSETHNSLLFKSFDWSNLKMRTEQVSHELIPLHLSFASTWWPAVTRTHCVVCVETTMTMPWMICESQMASWPMTPMCSDTAGWPTPSESF